MSALMGVSNFKTMWVGWPGRVRTKPACTCMHAYKLCCTHVHAIHTVAQLIMFDLKMKHSGMAAFRRPPLHQSKSGLS